MIPAKAHSQAHSQAQLGARVWSAGAGAQPQTLTQKPPLCEKQKLPVLVCPHGVMSLGGLANVSCF